MFDASGQSRGRHSQQVWDQTYAVFSFIFGQILVCKDRLQNIGIFQAPLVCSEFIQKFQYFVCEFDECTDRNCIKIKFPQLQFCGRSALLKISEFYSFDQRDNVVNPEMAKFQFWLVAKQKLENK